MDPATLRSLARDFADLVAAGVLQDTVSDAGTFLCAYLTYEEEHRRSLAPDTPQLIVLPCLDKDRS